MWLLLKQLLIFAEVTCKALSAELEEVATSVLAVLWIVCSYIIHFTVQIISFCTCMEQTVEALSQTGQLLFLKFASHTFCFGPIKIGDELKTNNAYLR